jgi:large subunit ribosomal protein L31
VRILRITDGQFVNNYRFLTFPLAAINIACYNQHEFQHLNMKDNLHPQFNTVKVICNSCKETFITGSTKSETVYVDICAKCHPFYTGKYRIVDTENLVRKFEKKTAQANKLSDKLKASKAKKNLRQTKVNEIKAAESLTLKDMIAQIK